METVETNETFTGQEILAIKCAVHAMIGMYEDLLANGDGQFNDYFTYLSLDKGRGADLNFTYEADDTRDYTWITATAYPSAVVDMEHVTDWTRFVRVYTKKIPQ